jgi:hypothetical protein
VSAHDSEKLTGGLAAFAQGSTRMDAIRSPAPDLPDGA